MIWSIFLKKLRWALVVSCGFSLFALTCIFWCPFVPVTWLLCGANPQKHERLSRRVVSANFRFILAYTKWSGMLDYTIYDSGKSRHPILISNHISLFDVLFLVGYFPEYLTFVHAKFYYNPIIYPIVRSAGFIPVLPSSPKSMQKAHKMAQDALIRGEKLLVFPEGTRSKSGQLGAFQRGAFRLAIEEKVLISAAVITSHEPLFNKVSLYSPPQKPVEFKVFFEGPLPVQSMLFGDSAKPHATAQPLAEIASFRKDLQALSRETRNWFCSRLSQQDIWPWNHPSSKCEASQ